MYTDSFSNFTFSFVFYFFISVFEFIKYYTSRIHILDLFIFPFLLHYYAQFFVINFFLIFVLLQTVAAETADHLKIENEILEKELETARLREGAKLQMIQNELLNITLQRDDLLLQVRTIIGKIEINLTV